jgi:hypothetical protein
MLLRSRLILCWSKNQIAKFDKNAKFSKSEFASICDGFGFVSLVKIRILLLTNISVSATILID